MGRPKGSKNKPKTPAEVAASAPTSLESAIKSPVAKSKAIRPSQTSNLKAKKEEGRQFYSVPFFYADGSVVGVKMRFSEIQRFKLPYLTKDNSLIPVKGENIRIVNTPKTKRFEYSMRSRISKKGNKMGKYTREWQSCSIPEDARQVDILFNLKQWKVQPEVIKINKKMIVTGDIKGIKVQKLKMPKPITSPN